MDSRGFSMLRVPCLRYEWPGCGCAVGESKRGGGNPPDLSLSEPYLIGPLYLDPGQGPKVETTLPAPPRPAPPGDPAPAPRQGARR